MWNFGKLFDSTDKTFLYVDVSINFKYNTGPCVFLWIQVSSISISKSIKDSEISGLRSVTFFDEYVRQVIHKFFDNFKVFALNFLN